MEGCKSLGVQMIMEFTVITENNVDVVCWQAIAQVRTVYSFVGEVKTQQAYSKALHRTLEMAKRAGIAKGLSVGLTHGLLIGLWGLLFWYASLLVLRKSTNGGQAFTTIINAVVSGL